MLNIFVVFIIAIIDTVYLCSSFFSLLGDSIIAIIQLKMSRILWAWTFNGQDDEGGICRINLPLPLLIQNALKRSIFTLSLLLLPVTSQPTGFLTAINYCSFIAALIKDVNIPVARNLLILLIFIGLFLHWVSWSDTLHFPFVYSSLLVLFMGLYFFFVSILSIFSFMHHSSPTILPPLQPDTVINPTQCSST